MRRLLISLCLLHATSPDLNTRAVTTDFRIHFAAPLPASGDDAACAAVLTECFARLPPKFNMRSEGATTTNSTMLDGGGVVDHRRFDAAAASPPPGPSPKIFTATSFIDAIRCAIIKNMLRLGRLSLLPEDHAITIDEFHYG